LVSQPSRVKRRIHEGETISIAAARDVSAIDVPLRFHCGFTSERNHEIVAAKYA
jgi:hypothetical protein